MNMDDSSQATITTPSSISVSKVFISTILCAIFLTNLLGNTCTCLVVFHSRSLRERPSSLLLSSLAVCDLFALLLPLFSLILLYDLQAACNVSGYFIPLVPVLFFINIVHNCLLSVDRYIAILHPLRYNVIVTTKRVKRALVIAWFSPFASACIGSLAYSDEQATSFRLGVIGCFSYSIEPPLSKKIHSALNFVGFGLIPILVTTFVYGRIAKVSWRQSNRTEPGTRLNPEQERRQRKEMKWMKTIVIVIAAFVLCHLPSLIIAFLRFTLSLERVPTALHGTGFLVFVANGSVNPIIYVFRSNEFRRPLRNAFRKYFNNCF
ncbi:adenosine receptor A2a-like [Acropora muricata]|uniref:adenosine receptor A2a-like n=1 Tax=Acropora muricata TaxID=159855 RepID=UPI0034E3BF81